MIMIIYIKERFKCRNHCAPEVRRLSYQFFFSSICSLQSFFFFFVWSAMPLPHARESTALLEGVERGGTLVLSLSGGSKSLSCKAS